MADRAARLRLTVAAVGVVGVVLVVSAVAFVVALRNALTAEVRTAARQRATEIATALDTGAAVSLAVSESDHQYVQVLDGSGRVTSSSPNVAGQPAVATLRPGQSRRVRASIDDDALLAVAVGAGDRTVVVARSLDTVDESAQVVTRLLLVGVPVLLVLSAGAAWWLAGRALAPMARAHARQRAFVSDASHELRSPLATIRQNAEVELAHPGSVPDLAATVQAEALRMQGLVDDLLLLARHDERAPVKTEPVDLDDVVLDEVRRLRETTTHHVDASAVSAGRVEGDAEALQRAVRNVAGNAARHARTTVAFGLAQHDGTVVLSVDDDGPGIAADDRERVFERFVRLDEARDRDGGGSGLGLAIVRSVVAAHGGTATVTESPLGGTRVEIRLRSAEVQDQRSRV